MKLSARYRLPNALYYFRVIVQIAVEEEILEIDDEGEELDPIRGYFQTFGVTAESHADATRLVEQMLARNEPKGGSSDDPKGSVQMIEATALDPAALDLDSEEWKTERGLHLTSGRVFFASDEAFEDEDPSGQHLIYQRIYDELAGEEGESAPIERR